VTSSGYPVADLNRFLERSVAGFDPSPDKALEPTLVRARRRRTSRQALATLSTVGVTAALVSGLWAVFRPVTPSVPSAEPIPGPSISPVPRFEGGTACLQLPRNQGRGCLSTIGRGLVVAEGAVGDSRWTLRAVRAVYEGPDPVRQGFDRPVGRNAVCMEWRFRAPPEIWCHGSSSEAGWAIAIEPDAFTVDAFVRSKPPHRNDAFRTWPYRFQGSILDPSFDVFYGWTAAETERMVAITEDGSEVPVRLTGPFTEQLGVDVKWYVVLVRPSSARVQVRALDANSSVLWDEEVEVLQRLVVRKAGSGAGAVRGYWTIQLESPPHAPTPKLDCGAHCWYAFAPGGSLPSGSFTLRAEPEQGSHFAGWVGPCEGQGPTCQIQLTRSTTVTAIFEPA
jgi:hypothetical protein